MDKNHDMYMKLKSEHSRLKKELKQEQGKNKRLQGEVSKLKEQLKDVKPGKSSQRVKEIREQLAEQERVNTVLHDTIYTLEQEKKQISIPQLVRTINAKNPISKVVIFIYTSPMSLF